MQSEEESASDDDLNVTLQRVFEAIENSAIGTDSEDDVKGLFDDVGVNSNKLGVTVQLRNEMLRKILIRSKSNSEQLLQAI